jgi:L-glutamine-phosphate cytidylyltransferase
MRALILAAGRGSRMGPLTEAQPKCLTVLAGRTLLSLQKRALADAGATPLGIVTGYRADTLAAPDLVAFHNPRWAETNMVASLACAEAWLDEAPCLVSYADIFYPAETVRRLARARAPLAIAYDPDWLALWSGRFADPLSDAETFRLDGDRVVEIGARPRSVDEVQGQYMGLLRFTPDSWSLARRIRAELPQDRRDRLDMTSLIAALIARGLAVEAVPTAPGWGEIDSAGDLAFYEARIASGALRLAA